jgi:hypothetical protein
MGPVLLAEAGANFRGKAGALLLALNYCPRAFFSKKKYMKAGITILSLLVLTLLSCEGKTKERLSSRGENYVPDPNYLYFKNTRGRNYRTEELPDKTILWKHDELFSSAASLQPVIRDVWLEDQAHLALYLNGKPSEVFRLEVFNEGDKTWSFVSTSNPLTAPQSEQLGQILGTQRGLRVITRSDTLVPFPEAPDRAAAKEVLDDYLRLLD